MSKKHYIIPIFISHEGCPHQCVFCNQDRIAKVVENEVTADDVRKTVEEYLKTIDYKNSIVEISFFGGTFTAINVSKQRELLAVAKEYKEKGFIQKIRMSTRPDAINTYILGYLKDYKVDIIELGVQSLDDEVLKLSGRGHSSIEVEKASKLIKEYKFTLGHQIMPGLPGDTFEKDIETVKKSISMKPDICRIYPALVIKDTPMERMYRGGRFNPYTLGEAVEISKKLYKMYRKADVNIVRVGLQATDNITWGKDIVDGPFHPAFRELVEGSLICDEIKSAINENEDVIIEINSRDLSKLYTNKKYYFNKLMDNHKGSIMASVNDRVKRGNINIIIVKRLKKVNI